MDGGAWWATVHGVAKSWTRLSDFTFIYSPPCQAQDRSKGKYAFNDHLKIMLTTNEWIKKMWYIYIMEYYSAIKK